jgi:hypothetical protein
VSFALATPLRGAGRQRGPVVGAGDSAAHDPRLRREAAGAGLLKFQVFRKFFQIAISMSRRRQTTIEFIKAVITRDIAVAVAAPINP